MTDSKASEPIGIIRSSSKALTVTSDSFVELKRELGATRDERERLLSELNAARGRMPLLSFLRLASFVLIFGFFYKRPAEAVQQQKGAIAMLEQTLAKTFVKIAFADASQFEKSWLNCVDAFQDAMTSEKLWDVTYAEVIDRVRQRTTAATAISRSQITYAAQSIDIIKTDVPAISIPNANGPDIFVFPTFLVLYKDRHRFGIFDLNQVSIDCSQTRYIEEESLPTDAETIDHVWKKANKDGSRDKRFQGNYQIPVKRYGQLLFEADGGLQECYMLSNADALLSLGNAFDFHKKILANQAR